jgi:hypothetical protein
MTPVQAAFVALILAMHPPQPCEAPSESYSSGFVISACQQNAAKGQRADSCWSPITHATYLPTSCIDLFTDYCKHLACHEVYRHIAQACMGKHFTVAEPSEVIEHENCLDSQ